MSIKVSALRDYIREIIKQELEEVPRFLTMVDSPKTPWVVVKDKDKKDKIGEYMRVKVPRL